MTRWRALSRGRQHRYPERDDSSPWSRWQNFENCVAARSWLVRGDRSTTQRSPAAAACAVWYSPTVTTPSSPGRHRRFGASPIACRMRGTRPRYTPPAVQIPHVGCAASGTLVPGVGSVESPARTWPLVRFPHGAWLDAPPTFRRRAALSPRRDSQVRFQPGLSRPFGPASVVSSSCPSQQISGANGSPAHETEGRPGTLS